MIWIAARSVQQRRGSARGDADQEGRGLQLRFRISQSSGVPVLSDAPGGGVLSEISPEDQTGRPRTRVDGADA